MTANYAFLGVYNFITHYQGKHQTQMTLRSNASIIRRNNNEPNVQCSKHYPLVVGLSSPQPHAPETTDQILGEGTKGG